MEKRNKTIEEYAFRILSLLDRDFFSDTQGCFDKLFWHYKRTTFLNGMMQCYLFNLAQIAEIINKIQDQKSNTTSCTALNHTDLVESIINSIQYTLRNQHSDGSFDEHYLNEKSYVTTSFVGIAILKASEIVKKLNSTFQINAAMEESIKQLIKWIIKNNEIVKISNHVAGSILLLLLAYLQYHDMNILTAIINKFQILFSFQNSEGWFDEYGGLDIGYLTLTLSFLIESYEITNKIVENKDNIQNLTKLQELIPKIRTSITDLVAFFTKIYTPEIFHMRYLWSRKNNHFFIAGFFQLRKHSDLMKSTEKPIIDNLISTYLNNYDEFQTERINDDFFSFFEMNDMLSRKMEEIMNPEQNFEKMEISKEIRENHFPNSGIFMKNTNRGILAINYNQRNVIYFTPKQDDQLKNHPQSDNISKGIIDTGIVIHTKSGDKYNSYILHTKHSRFEKLPKIEQNQEIIQIIQDGNFTKKHTQRLTPWKSILLSILGGTLLRVDIFNRWIKGILLRSTVQNLKSSMYHMKRIISIENDLSLNIQDEIQMHQEEFEKLAFIGISQGLNPFFVPSGEFFTQNQYKKPIELHWTNENVAKDGNSVVLSFSRKYCIK